MGDITKIEWAHSSVNLWVGCTEISDACRNCYAKRMAPRLGMGVVWNSPPVKAQTDKIAELRRMNRGAARFLAKHGERRRIFINSMSDFFDNQAPQLWREEAFMAFDECADVDILLVTKRPQNILRMIPLHWRLGGWPPHVWLIVTAENKEEAARRCKSVRDVIARTGVRTVGASIEPMLERIPPEYLAWANWWIVGGESGGAKSREMDLAWPRELMHFAAQYGARFFFKQTTNKGPIPADLQKREFPL